MTKTYSYDDILQSLFAFIYNEIPINNTAKVGFNERGKIIILTLQILIRDAKKSCLPEIFYLKITNITLPTLPPLPTLPTLHVIGVEVTVCCLFYKTRSTILNKNMENAIYFVVYASVMHTIIDFIPLPLND